jgi:uncharacterized protein (TIGR00369 family)
MDEAHLAKQREILKMGAKAAPIIQFYGMLLDYNEKNEAVWTLPFNENLTNGLDVHGGAIATLIDNAGWFTLGQYYEHWITTVEFSTRLLDTAKKDDLVATGHVAKLGKRISTATMEVVSKTDGRTIAIGSGTYAVTSVPLRAWLVNPRST